MTIKDFIFSKRNRIRVCRHLAFWGLFIIVLFLNAINFENGPRDLMFFRIYELALLQVALFLPTYIILVYIFMYFLTPKFIHAKRYFAFAIGAGLTLTGCFFLNLLPSYLFLHIAYPNLSNADFHQDCYRLAYGIGVFLGVGVAGCVTGIKLSKEWYLQQIENARLAKEEVSNKTRLLKSQIQPEFIFQSLQNLQKKIDSSDDNAAEMVLHLSEIYSYILYDCKDEFISLEKELSVIQHLISVKELIEENGSGIRLQVNGDCNAKYICPLALFSFLESRTYNNEKEMIDINIDVVDEILELTLQSTIISESAIRQKKINDNMGKENIINARFELITSLQEEDALIPLKIAN